MIRALFLTILLLGPAAGAQILPRTRLPGLPGGLPGDLPGNAGISGLAQQTGGALTDPVARLEDARKLQIRLLLRRHADEVEADANGDPVVRGEVLAFSPTDAALARAGAAGFSILRESALAPLGMRIVTLGVPAGTSTLRGLRWLRQLDPQGSYDFNSIYMESGASAGAGARREAADGRPGQAAPGAPPRSSVRGTALVVGLVDGGVASAQPVLRDSVVHQHGCGGATVPSAHGTEVASLMVGRAPRFGGAAPGATLYAADVYCGKPTGGSVTAIAEALAWLVGQRVPVINVSLVGPPNALLQQVVERVVAQGCLIVAAVGNDGPAAPPLYPAAYPGVVGVTAVDSRQHVIFEAERGPQVMFAAPGADITAATIPDGFTRVRGTSFAAPLVAGLLAAELRAPGSAQAHQALDSLARAAIHLGAPGRNPIFGYGLVGADLPSSGQGFAADAIERQLARPSGRNQPPRS